jgi:hypothetical protein
MELIEKLKDKTYVRAFGLMLPEEQKCFRDAGTKNCLFLSEPAKDFIQAPDDYVLFYFATTYAIKPDYQPEPEFEDIEIIKQGNWLGITRPWAGDYSRFPHDFTHLYCLPSLPNFLGFFTGDMKLRYDEVSTHMQGKPYVRFRK